MQTKLNKPNIGDEYVNKIRNKIQVLERVILKTEALILEENAKRLQRVEGYKAVDIIKSQKTTEQAIKALTSNYNKLADLKRMEASGLDQHANWLDREAPYNQIKQ